MRTFEAEIVLGVQVAYGILMVMGIALLLVELRRLTRLLASKDKMEFETHTLPSACTMTEYFVFGEDEPRRCGRTDTFTACYAEDGPTLCGTREHFTEEDKQ